MSDREVSRTSGVSSNDNEIVLVAAAGSGVSSNDNEIVLVAAGSTDQPDSDAEEQKDVYVEVTVLAKELKRKKGSIKVEQLLIWDYVRIHRNASDEIREFFMQHIKADGTVVQMGICQRGPFGPATRTDCNKIYFHGPDTDLTMSNQDNSLYLRARRLRAQGRTVVARPQPPNVNSHFKVHKVAVTSLQSVSISRGLVATIEVINKPRLYFKYDDALDVVLTDALNGPQHPYEFILMPVETRDVHFVRHT